MGKVLLAYIPNRRSYLHNDKFGFVKLSNKEEGSKAIKSMDGMLIRGHHIVLKFARSPNSSGVRNRRNQNAMESNPINHYWKSKFPLMMHSCPFVIPKKFIPPIKVVEVGNEWLSKIIIAKLSRESSIALVQDQLQSLGLANIEVKPLGGDNVVLTFNSISERESVFSEGQMAWIQDCGMDVINQVVELECKGILSPIRVIEEQIVVNATLKPCCVCSGHSTDSVTHTYLIADEEKEGDKFVVAKTLMDRVKGAGETPGISNNDSNKVNGMINEKAIITIPSPAGKHLLAVCNNTQSGLGDSITQLEKFSTLAKRRLRNSPQKTMMKQSIFSNLQK
ncbi:hypothetical protein Vadar_015102 [Vaccinium darrowii]|nr:hypothetical protein Vadar_015102 [Vaccinium darrowii]